MSGHKAFLLLVSVAGAICAVAAAAAADSGSGNGAIVYGSNGRLYAVDPTGGPETDLGPGTMPAWSPDGSQLAFLDGGTSAMNADGSARRLLHQGVDRQVAWSPDGTRLALVTQSLAGNGALVVVDLQAGTTSTAVAGGVDLDLPPAWSPDGTKLAYTDRSSGVVAVVDADGSDRRVLATGSAPAWSPDGTQVAFLHGAPGERPSVHVISAGGASLRRLTTTETPFSYTGPSWSPDGTRIAFTGSRITSYDRFGPTYSSAVHVVDAEGTLERRLTESSTIPGTASPVWSPDGKRILVSALGYGPFFMNPDGTCETRITERPVYGVSWRPIPGAPAAPLLRCADLEVTATQERTAIPAGAAATFQLVVKNRENEDATGVRLTAAAPVGGSIESASTEHGACQIAAGALSCRLGDLPVGELARVTVGIRTAGPGSISALARADAEQPDGQQENNSAPLRLEALPCGLVARDSGERLVGTSGRDAICGRWGPDWIWALAGDDFVDAGPQADHVFPGPGHDTVFLRAGADFADARDGQRDTIVCGGESDLVLVDRSDRTSKDCEHVEEPRIHRCKTIGTIRSDELGGSTAADEVCALSGNDAISTLAGDDAVDAGSGNDTVYPGKGRDVVLGAAGYDTIFARDGDRDRIRCGPQDDLVFADRVDLVARDCERVQRASAR
jgi:Tol biopolymer transport system component